MCVCVCIIIGTLNAMTKLKAGKIHSLIWATVSKNMFTW